MLQCSLTGGSFKCEAMSVFLIERHSSIDLPLIHSVATELHSHLLTASRQHTQITPTYLAAMADPHPKVLNLASSIVPSSATRICSFITSPQAGAPTTAVPTFFAVLSKLPAKQVKYATEHALHRTEACNTREKIRPVDKLPRTYQHCGDSHNDR
jgi:hypothetical protein